MMTAQEFKTYVYQVAQEIGVSQHISSIHLRKMKTKIASCSTKGRITFDTSLLEYTDQQKIKEIIIHELLHLRYKNHGKMFKMMLNYYINKL
ncbi:MAG: M48 family metallopeptidase [Candidatus Micrarchaeia archaeon]